MLACVYVMLDVIVYIGCSNRLNEKIDSPDQQTKREWKLQFGRRRR